MKRHGFGMLPTRVVLVLVMALQSAIGAADGVKYGVERWDDTLGSHRAVIQVTEECDAVRLHLPWRRPDRDPEKKRIFLVDAKTRKTIDDCLVIRADRESCDLVFQPATVPGTYYLYYFAHTVQPGSGGYGGDYLPPQATARPEWLARHRLDTKPLAEEAWKKLPEATLLELQARTEFERFDPMEVIATAVETQAFLAVHTEPYLLFPEDRRHPIRMRDDLPLRWIATGPSDRFRGEAQRNEYYAFQIGVYAARQSLEELAVEFDGLRSDSGGTIPATALACFNLGGKDWLGKPFRKVVNVAQGKVQALWFGIDVPREAQADEYRGTLTIRARNAEARAIHLSLAVSDPVLPDRGDGELWRHSRLRWLDSTIGIDDEIVPPYTPLAVEGRVVRCLGRALEFGDTGLPVGIRSGQEEILAAPVSLVVLDGSAVHTLSGGEPKLVKRSPGSVVWESQGHAGPLCVATRANFEFDGHLEVEIVLEATSPVELRDARLEIPLRREAATYLMGIGRKGGHRPRDWSWKWGGQVYHDSFWIGDVDAGLQCELRGASYSGPMVNLYWPAGQLQPPESWHNGGRGGCTVSEIGNDRVLVRAYCGARTIEPGKPLRLEFAFLITPVKPLATKEHFRSRYYHAYEPVDRAVQAGANIINIHHANELNPFINYPFLANEKLSAYVREAHAKGAKVKLYYTVRELTNHVTELWALRSLGDEVFASGQGGGYPWLREHLGSDYRVSWYDRLEDGEVSASLVTSGASRWYNYYLEGLAWLLTHLEIDGLYLDDVTYDREILKRMRKIMARTRPGCLIDLHSNTAFSRGPANQYLEFFPFIDSLWFGEGFDYNDPPDYWLVEISGIPFGLMGEMLQDGGNKWRGMLYGMTARMPWCGDPRSIWKTWDDFGIAEARMVGYWNPGCPVRTDRADVLATAYVRPGKTLVALASWAPAAVECPLSIDTQALGLGRGRTIIEAPEIEGFQAARSFRLDEPIPVQPGRGWILIVSEAP